MKVPIALAVLQGVDDDEFRLDQRLTLEAEDKVDGSGDLVWQDNGVDYSLRDLLKEMLIESDNTAANMLIRLVGEDALNQRTRKSMGGDFEAITSFTCAARRIRRGTSRCRPAGQHAAGGAGLSAVQQAAL